MFVTADQIFIFAVCVMTGATGGVIYDFLMVIRVIKSRVAIFVADVLFCVILAFLYLYTCYLFYFPAVRAYMFLGICLGLLAYAKSFHVAVAFVQKNVYNILSKKLATYRCRKKEKQRDRVQAKKTDYVHHRHRGTTCGDFVDGDVLSVDFDERAKKEARPSKIRNRGTAKNRARNHRRSRKVGGFGVD